MLNLARNNQPFILDPDNRSMDSVQLTSSRTTPSRSWRWRRVVSDTESDGFDSGYGESEVISYGSDASVDLDSFVEETDTDIDPMHTGLNPWSSDNDEGEWEEGEPNENTLEALIARVHLRRSMALGELTHQGESTHPVNSVRNFEELMERLAEADNSRRGAPPASVSFVKNLERVVVKTEDENGSACAICKDFLCVGSVVNRLPCFHVYHPSCIEPWLSARNSCPLCRCEFPTDDVDYEDRKRSAGGSHRGEEGPEREEVGFEEGYEGPGVAVDGGSGGGRWLFVVAPVVSLVGIAVALWLGNRGGIRVCGSSYGRNEMGGNRRRRWWSLF